MAIKILTQRFKKCFLTLVLGAACISPVPCRALEPDGVLVLANKNATHSVELAKYYMKKRGIPERNPLQLWVTDKEWCSREDYEKKVVAPVRGYIKEKDPLGRFGVL